MNRLNNSLITLVAISAKNESSSSLSSFNSTISRSINGTNNNFVANNMTNSSEADRSKKSDEAVKIIRESQVICFDVDSTVIIEEGIDELANYCGKGQEVARLTKEAMKGSMSFQDALRLRLNIIKPTREQIRDFLKTHPSTLSPGVKEFIHLLRSLNKNVYLISGGFDCLIEPVANDLGVPLSNLFANKLLFYYNGNYAGFDTNQPTSRSGGKGEAIATIRRSLNDNDTTVITMIGDGATDLEASPPANHFIGYGGNIVREEVRNRAQYYITDFDQITSKLR